MESQPAGDREGLVGQFKNTPPTNLLGGDAQQLNIISGDAQQLNIISDWPVQKPLHQLIFFLEETLNN